MLQGTTTPSLTGARPFSSSDAHDDEARRRIAPKPTDQASPSQHTSPPDSPPSELASTSYSSALIPTPPGLALSSPPTYNISAVLHNQMLYDRQAIAHLLQQDLNATSTTQNMEQAFLALRAEHLQADEARRVQDAHTQHIIQVGIQQIASTHERLLTTEQAAERAATTAAQHIQQRCDVSK
jgi:hypothetical protein